MGVLSIPFTPIVNPNLEAALSALAGPSHSNAAAVDHVPDRPGLYAVHAGVSTWQALGLTADFACQPLYFGKAERSLVSRNLRTHFETGMTGTSTLRRSFAALLRQPLELHGIPRSRTNPGYFANFALADDGERRLTHWMRTTLTLAVWAKPNDVILRPVEVGVLGLWAPPLNLTDVPTPSPRLKSARKVMAHEARGWAHDHGFNASGLDSRF